MEGTFSIIAEESSLGGCFSQDGAYMFLLVCSNSFSDDAVRPVRSRCYTVPSW
jgi:hypothetical protein